MRSEPAAMHLGLLRPIAVLLMGGLLACAAARAVERDDLEAAIIYNILLFVDWPPAAMPAADLPLVLCIEPGSRLGRPLKSLAGRRVRTHALVVRDLPAAEPPGGCHALYVDSHPAPLPQRRQWLGVPLLVIGSEPLPADEAVAVRLGESAGRVAFDVDLPAVRQAGLQISSRLLRLARRVAE